VTAVVTGAAGFIGRTLVSALRAAGERVIGIDREPQGAQPGVDLITAELLGGDPAVLAALAEADAVFHLAGCPGVRDEAPGIAVRRYRDNVLATAFVTAAVPLRTPLVVTSSSSVYGGAGHGRPSGERDRLRPRGGYAESKVLVERICESRIEAGGAATVVRPFTVAGEGQRPDMALARWIAAARAGRALVIFGSRNRSRDLTDVRHVADALIALAARGHRGPVNVGTGTGHTLAALVAAIAEALDRDVEVAVGPAEPAEVADTRADTRLLRRLIGWAPETDLPALVRRQIAATLAQTAAPSVEAVP
jgi:nucleoside-diphosphate-sugar epimerase